MKHHAMRLVSALVVCGAGYSESLSMELSRASALIEHVGRMKTGSGETGTSYRVRKPVK